MKQAYVSLVLPLDSMPSPKTLSTIDSYLESQTRAHEIVLVMPSQSLLLKDEVMWHGPVTVVITHHKSTPDAALIAGMARSVGDFVMEWRGPLEVITEQLLIDAFTISDSGAELVEITTSNQLLMSRVFTKLINALRPHETPVHHAIGRIFSRHSLQALLRKSLFDPQVDVLVADLPVRRSLIQIPVSSVQKSILNHDRSKKWALLVKGTRFGSIVPLVLAATSALFGFSAALYAVGLMVFRGQTPEGWTTLMVVIGLSQATILTMLGLIWSRIDSLIRGLSRSHDATANVLVIPPGAPSP
jgi:hypothetical protein